MLRNEPFKRKKLNNLLIKPAGPDCNLHCDYCFYFDKSRIFPESRTHRMSLKILEEMTRQFMSQGEQKISFNWQGGEPTLMGLDFFKQAIFYQQKYGHQQFVANTFQTNGLLIDKNWARFFWENKFLVGLSLDGPEHIHNRYRHFQNGSGCWHKVVDAAKLLLDSGVEVNALVVINDYSANFPEEIYEFLKGIGLNFMQFIPCLERDPNRPQYPTGFSVSSEKYGNFLIKLYELWKADFVDGKPLTYIRNFEAIVFVYAGLSPPDCTLTKECGNYLVVEHNGNVYPCDFFVQPELKLGNVVKNRLVDLLNSAKQRQFGKSKAKLPDECKKCSWLKFCRGGCLRKRGYEPHPEKSYYCEAYKQFYANADPFFQKIIRELKINSPVLS